MTVFAGVDGGGTKTELFLLEGVSGEALLLKGQASNPTTVGLETARARVVDLLEQGLAKLHKTSPDMSGLCVALAGADRQEEAAAWQRALEARFPSSVVEVVNDALAALTAGTRGTSGVVLIAGTGSIAVGETNKGVVKRAGGYGYLLGDEGSGFAIGQAGLRAAIQSFEARGPHTSLWEQATRFYQVHHPQELIPKIYGSTSPVSLVAAFAPLVISESQRDEAAIRIMEQAYAHYRLLLESVYDQIRKDLDEDGISNLVVLSGGVFTGVSGIAERLCRTMQGQEFRLLRQSAASGAALRAIHHYLKSTSAVHRSHQDGLPLIRAWESAVRG